jgi:predicted DCC family thiol-disulfide oxidoreductase YuxK
MPEWTLFYDGGCNLCHQGKLRVEQWARRAGVNLRVEVLQSAEAVGKGYGDAMVLEVGGRPLFGADAWIETMKIAPFPFRLALWLPRPLLRFGYGLVARNRYRIFGRRSCPIPPNGVSRR